MNYTVVGAELLQEERIRVNGCAGEDGKVLKPDWVAGGLEVINKVDKLGIDI